MLKNNPKGFTIAEVLVTLSIIGIVAAMTLPGIVVKNQKKKLHAQLLVGYSLLMQALTKMQAETGITPNAKNFPSRTFKPEYIKYFDNPIDCGLGGIWSTKQSQLCGAGQRSDNMNIQVMNDYKSYNKAVDRISSIPLDDGQFALKNGMLIMIENYTTLGRVYISIDVNGATKGPNQWGHDLFTFQLMNNGKLLPMGHPETDYHTTSTCSKTSTSDVNGISCTNEALTNSEYWNNL